MTPTSEDLSSKTLYIGLKVLFISYLSLVLYRPKSPFSQRKSWTFAHSPVQILLLYSVKSLGSAMCQISDWD